MLDSGRQVDVAASLAWLSEPVRAWFAETFSEGPTPAQALAWPAIAADENLLLISPTGSGKTLAAFLAILDRLIQRRLTGSLVPGLACVYVSPLRSLGYDIERNLSAPLEALCERLGWRDRPIRVGARTGDTSGYQRRKLAHRPPEILITTPESLSLMLSQPRWREHWRGVRHLIVDEIHALVPTKRGADLTVSLERLSALADADPARIGLSATCRPAQPVSDFLVGPSRTCRIVEAPPPIGSPPVSIEVESLIEPGEGLHRGLSYHRLLRRLRQETTVHRTTLIFANTRAFTEKLTHDLIQGTRRERATRANENDQDGADTDDDRNPPFAAHHSALDAGRRRAVEAALKAGLLRAVVSSTSLELGVDIGTADLTVQVGLPGGSARCLQRVGRSGRRRGATAKGLILAASAAELAGAVVTARAAREGRIEPLKAVSAPLDVVCQQLVAMACQSEQQVDEVFALLKRAGPMAGLTRADFEACLASLAGELAAPAGAMEEEPGAAPRWTSPRIWKRKGWFGVRSRRVVRWFWTNVGTILSEESVSVRVDGEVIGSLEFSYAERLQAGDRFVLDGRSLEYRRMDGMSVIARASGEEPNLPRWSSDRQALSRELAADLAVFREEAARRLEEDGPTALRGWLIEALELEPTAAAVLIELFELQGRVSEIPRADALLVEDWPSPLEEAWVFAFHAPLNRSACEALGRALCARIGRLCGRDASLRVADLGWSIAVPADAGFDPGKIGALLSPDRLEDDVIDGLDRGELLASRFRHVASTALMVLRNPEPGRRVRVGGLSWVSRRLYPLVQATCPEHPLLREVRREVLNDRLDLPAAKAWLERKPRLRLRSLDAASPFASAWIEPAAGESHQFESADDALRRLHARLTLASQVQAGERGSGQRRPGYGPGQE
jgi:ATP-dependent Lhr-like helicase